MQVTDIVRHEGLSFEQYLRLHGYSCSSFKGAEIKPTFNMLIGTLVHRYLLEPASYNQEHSEIVKPIATAVKSFLGSSLSLAKKEISYTAKFHYEGFILPYRGRVDMELPNQLVIDLKIINGKSINETIEHFGYKNPLSGYCYVSNCPKALLVAYSRRTKKTETKLITPSPEWWQSKILTYGTPSK